ncbi:MAG: hypothetical protein J1F22_04370 [Lachnospiraceae bacterium]|nr:hypothetical protein [Lachnospiraceae bacterium]
MIEWDSRMQNNHSVQLLKAAIPFFDVAVGEMIDLEGLFRAIRPFTGGRERWVIDILLQFFQMERMMSMMQLMNAMQSREGDPQDMSDILRATLSPEQQDTVDMVSSMMSMMQMPEEAGKEEDESVDF